MEKAEQIAFSDADADLMQDYKSLNVIAVLAFLLSLVTPIALMNVFFGGFIAFPAIVLSLSSLSSINKNIDTQTGKSWAVAGLLIASFFASFGMARHFSRKSTLAGLAHNCAGEFLDHLKKGELYSAHQLMIHPHERRHPNVSFELFYEKNPAAKKSKESVQSRYPLSQIIAVIDSTKESTGQNESRGDVQFEYVGVTELFEELGWEVIILRFRMNYVEQTQNKTLPFDIMVGRQETKNGQAEWKIQSVTSPDEAR
jgi:hypothetical protein